MTAQIATIVVFKQEGILP